MKTYLKNHHKIFSKEESVEVTDLKKEATEKQLSLILNYMVMFIVTAGLSFRTIENKYFKMLLNEFFQVKFK